MKESVFITTIVYALYWIFLGIFGVLLGFLLGLYRRKDEIDEIYVFFLLLLLHILYSKGWNDDVLLRYLQDLSLEPKTAESFSNPQMERRPFKLILKEPENSIPNVISQLTWIFWSKNLQIMNFSYLNFIQMEINFSKDLLGRIKINI